MKSLMRNSAFDEVLEREVYQQPALMPPSPWLGRAQPAKPKLTVANGEPGSQLEIRWTPGGSGKAWLWLLQTRIGGEWTTEDPARQPEPRAFGMARRRRSWRFRRLIATAN